MDVVFFLGAGAGKPALMRLSPIVLLHFAAFPENDHFLKSNNGDIVEKMQEIGLSDFWAIYKSDSPPWMSDFWIQAELANPLCACVYPHQNFVISRFFKNRAFLQKF